MTQSPATEDSPGSALFPEYESLYELIAAEVTGLTDEQLDFESDRWGWSEWSIRRQLSHMASLLYRWMLVRWGETLFPDGGHGVDDVTGVAASDFDRRMEETRYWELPAILNELHSGIDLARRVMSERSVGFLRSHEIPHQRSPQWVLMHKAHPTGITPAADSEDGSINLEATLRHMYFEETTHLYNIQRLKRAQGLQATVEVPKVGYWVLEGWDRSEA